MPRPSGLSRRNPVPNRAELDREHADLETKTRALELRIDSLAYRQGGRVSSSDLVMVQGAFTQAGLGHIIIRCVTGEGVSAGVQTAVRVGDGAAENPGP